MGYDPLLECFLCYVLNGHNKYARPLANGDDEPVMFIMEIDGNRVCRRCMEDMRKTHPDASDRLSRAIDRVTSTDYEVECEVCGCVMKCYQFTTCDDHSEDTHQHFLTDSDIEN